MQFANEKSFDKAIQAFQARTLNYYKNEFYFRSNEFFGHENHRFQVPRTVTDLSDKYWRNTIDAIKFLAQFAIYGRVEAYRVSEGKIINHEITEPKNDKQISIDYHQALQMIQKGQILYPKVKELLLSVLNIEPRHAQAAEYLSWIMIKEKNLQAAVHQLTEIIKLETAGAKAFYLRGIAFYRLKEYEKALADFDQSVRLSLAIQDVHWKSRLQKAKTLLELNVVEDAEKELKFFVDRTFERNSENDLAKKDAFLYLGQVHFIKQSFDQSLQFIEKALSVPASDQTVSDAKCLYYRGMVRQKLGVQTFSEDFEKARQLGYTVAS